ncbi:hypothetical protein RhiJN_20057 [Ceratobasidium sp. AG-Ba]|nr:hypothetical protein RhiJN_20057 [Ceratobasidium sp. AG-Ba]
MKSLTKSRAKIETLGLFPDAEYGNHDENGESNFLACLSGDPFYTYAANMTYLRQLVGTSAWLKPPSIQILAQLPLLESITAYRSEDECEDVDLSEDSFPSLRTLLLRGWFPSEFDTLMDIEGMVGNLTELDIQLDLTPFVDDDDPDEVHWDMEQFFDNLLQAPFLTKLRIDPDPTGELKRTFVLDGTSVRSLRKLPLQHLHLGSMLVVTDAFSEWFWPSMISLHIPKQTGTLVTVYELLLVLPTLESLELELHLKPEPAVQSALVQPSLRILKASPESRICSGFKDIDSVAR